MPLVEIWHSNPESIASYAIRQIVAIAGDGRLRDSSTCSGELRSYLREAPSEKLAQYALECLEEAFEDSGLVLQDVVNEMGRRLEFEVEDGRYRSGGQSSIAFDGVWRVGSERAIIVEVKTTDQYNMRLDAVAGYRRGLIQSARVPSDASTLFVVGRKDTGALEAQIRGSPHAWDMRVVGVESLIKLVQIKEKSTADTTVRQIRELLRPLEYTRVDRIIEVVFETASDVEQASETVASEVAGPEAEGEQEVAASGFTSTENLNAKRDQILRSLSKKFGSTFVRKRGVLYETPDGRRACVSLSKRYGREYQPYWYAFHPAWRDFLNGTPDGIHILGCMDLGEAFVLPMHVLEGLLPKLNRTTRTNGDTYWHIVITTMENGKLGLYSSQTGEKIPLDQFSMPLIK